MLNYFVFKKNILNIYNETDKQSAISLITGEQLAFSRKLL